MSQFWPKFGTVGFCCEAALEWIVVTVYCTPSTISGIMLAKMWICYIKKKGGQPFSGHRLHLTFFWGATSHMWVKWRDVKDAWWKSISGWCYTLNLILPYNEGKLYNHFSAFKVSAGDWQVENVDVIIRGCKWVYPVCNSCTPRDTRVWESVYVELWLCNRHAELLLPGVWPWETPKVGDWIENTSCTKPSQDCIARK